MVKMALVRQMEEEKIIQVKNLKVYWIKRESYILIMIEKLREETIDIKLYDGTIKILEFTKRWDRETRKYSIKLEYEDCEWMADEILEYLVSEAEKVDFPYYALLELFKLIYLIKFSRY